MCRILRKFILESSSKSGLKAKHTRVDDSIDENLTRNKSVVVLVHLAEQIREAGLLMVHELQELRKREKKQLE